MLCAGRKEKGIKGRRVREKWEGFEFSREVMTTDLVCRKLTKTFLFYICFIFFLIVNFTSCGYSKFSFTLILFRYTLYTLELYFQVSEG